MVSIVLVWLVLRDAELDQIAAAFAAARIDFIFLAFLLTCSSYVLRAVRWRYLLSPLGSIGLGLTLRATVIGFSLTAILPGRVGEIARPYLLARRAGLSAASVFATVVVERIFDLISILLIFGASVLVFNPAFVVQDEQLLSGIYVGAVFAMLGALVSLSLARVVATRPELIMKLAAWVSRRCSRRFASAIVGGTESFVDGFGVMLELRVLMWSMSWSLVLWGTIVLGLWLVSMSFGITLPLPGAGVMLVLVAVGVAIPTPAGVGGYHAAYQIGATGLYDAPVEVAVGAGLVAHAVSFLPVMAVGVVLMVKEGMHFHDVSQLSVVDSDENKQLDGRGHRPKQQVGGNGEVLP